MNSSRQTNGDQARCNQDPDQVTIAHFHDLAPATRCASTQAVPVPGKYPEDALKPDEEATRDRKPDVRWTPA